MMTKIKKILPLILCCAAFSLPAQNTADQQVTVTKSQPAKTEIYETIKAELSKLPHRVPGTSEYSQTISAIEKAFKEQGLELKRQTYPTLVPEITKKEFRVNGKEVEIFPLAPNNAALISTGEHALEGPLVYISNERLKSNNFGHVDGKIVLLDWGENYYPKVFFPEGAKAIIFVGNDEATQWDVAKMLSQYNIAFPYFYISREAAESQGINLLKYTPETKEENLPQASLICHSQWKQVEGINLWLKLEGKTDAAKEALFLNARFDTFGTVPEKVAGERQAENIALLAQTAVNLSKENLDSTVFVVFYGSSFNAYDGLRFFYYPVFKRKDIPATSTEAKEVVKEKNNFLGIEITANSFRTVQILIILLICCVIALVTGIILCVRAKNSSAARTGKSFIVGGIFSIILVSAILFFLGIPAAQEKGSNRSGDSIAKYTLGFEREKADNIEKLKILENPAPIIRPKMEYSAKDYQQFVGLGFGALVLFAGLFLLAFMIKKYTEKEQFNFKKYLVGGSLVSGIGVLCIFFFALIFDTSLPDAEKESLKGEMDKKLLAIREWKGAFNDDYYKLIEEYDELQKDYYNGEEDSYHDEVRQLLRTAVIKEYNTQNYRLAELNVSIRKHDKENEGSLKKITAYEKDLATIKKDIAANEYAEAEQNYKVNGKTVLEEAVAANENTLKQTDTGIAVLAEKVAACEKGIAAATLLKRIVEIEAKDSASSKEDKQKNKQKIEELDKKIAELEEKTLQILDAYIAAYEAELKKDPAFDNEAPLKYIPAMDKKIAAIGKKIAAIETEFAKNSVLKNEASLKKLAELAEKQLEARDQKIAVIEKKVAAIEAEIKKNPALDNEASSKKIALLKEDLETEKNFAAHEKKIANFVKKVAEIETGFKKEIPALSKEISLKKIEEYKKELEKIQDHEKKIANFVEKIATLKKEFAAIETEFKKDSSLVHKKNEFATVKVAITVLGQSLLKDDIAVRSQVIDVQKKEKAVLDVTKTKIANMRKAINERLIVVDEEEKDKYLQRKLLQTFVDEIEQSLKERDKELEVAIPMGNDWTTIAQATNEYKLRGIYYFDLASADEPFFFATRTYEALHYMKELKSSNYLKFFEKFDNALQNMPLTQKIFFKESLDSSTSNSVNTLSSLSLVYLPHAATLPLSETFSTTLRNISNKYDFDEMPGKHPASDLKPMVPVMTEMFTVLANDKEFSDKAMTTMFEASKMYDDIINYFYTNSPQGRQFSILSADGKEIDGPAAGAISIVQQNEYDRILPMAGFSMVALGQINKIGYTTMPLLTGGGRWGRGNYELHAAAIGFDEFGHVKYMSSADKTKLFRAYGGPHFYPYAPLTSNFAGSLSFVNGFTDGKFKNSKTYARVATGDGYAYADMSIKSKLYFDNETFMLGEIGEITAEKPTGEGITTEPERLKNLNVNRIAIDNTIELNKQRLEKLHSRNLFNDVVERYHDKAEQHKQDADEAHSEGDLNLARAHEIFGQTLAVQAYRPLKNLIEDLVQSVLILLILTIPFSFALERLLIGATNIYRQMAWILVFFIGTFLMLYFTHPAFAMSQSPMIIFIAFFIIVMSVMVIYIVMSRFKSELLAMQGMDTSAHRVNSENSMLLAAIMIGVSSMRNRPVKTFLTILTVVLLTFTIISFASFDSTTYVRPVYMGTGTGEQRIESFLPQHVDLLEPLCRSMKELYKDDYHVYFRSASYNSPFYILPTYPTQTNVIYNPKFQEKDEAGNPKPQTIELDAVVGFEPAETASSEKLGKLMAKMRDDVKANKYVASDVPGVYLSRTRAASLGLKVGDEFYLRTMKVRLDGIFEAKDLDDFTYLDNGKATPPNFNQTASVEATGIFAVLNSAYVDASNFIWSSPDLTLLTDYETAKKVNGFVNAVIFYPKSDDIDIRKDATDIAEVTFGIVYSNTASHGVERHFMAPVFEASGLSNLLVPLLLGALIILSSLLGSIADREREIFTFSALGLSPKDVSCLFFAESSVYAVIGGLGGYLLSQITNAVLTYLAKRGLLEAPEMNFSSMTTVYTILIVMAIVLLSTVYPAIKAGRAASPDVARKWKMPPPDGDLLCFQFPFTVSRVDFGGILMFIGEHFSNHADSSLGSFAASNIRIEYGKSEYTDGYMLTANFTLAPFDLGVAEEMSMYSAPSDIEGIDVVTVRITRKDGSKGAWMRGNTRFVGEIRNQFLLWRSLPVETVMHYRELAAKKLDVKAVDAEGAQA